MNRLYLDYNASAPPRPQAVTAAAEAMQLHNASAIYAEGRAARAAVESARLSVAQLCGAGRNDEIIFTSGGTESCNMACNLAFNLHGDTKPSRLIISATEHAAVLQSANASPLPKIFIGATADGTIDLAALQTALASDSAPALVCVQAANNETGVLQPLGDIAALVREHGSLLFCDAVQAAGKIKIDFTGWQCDALALSAHKLGGIMGAGALVVRGGLRVAPLISGGGQELGLRGGTENISGIVAFGKAAELATPNSEWKTWRDKLETSLRTAHPELVIFGEHAPRLANTSCFALPNTNAETLLMKLDLAGVAISSGAACSSGKVEQSHVLAAMGVAPALAAGALRVSFGWQTTADELQQFTNIFLQLTHSNSQEGEAA